MEFKMINKLNKLDKIKKKKMKIRLKLILICLNKVKNFKAFYQKLFKSQFKEENMLKIN